MRHSPHHAVTDESVVRELIAENPWATLLSTVDGELVASHYPVLIDEGREDLAIVTHVGRPDDRLHRFGESEMLLIVAGPHGYISPSWYAPGAVRAPTWNFSVAHCYGVPEILDPDENVARAHTAGRALRAPRRGARSGWSPRRRSGSRRARWASDCRSAASSAR